MVSETLGNKSEIGFLPKGCAVVYTDCYPIKQAGDDEMALVEQARKSLQLKGAEGIIRNLEEAGPSRIEVFDSQEKRMVQILLDLTYQLNGLGRRGKETRLIVIANEDPSALVKAAGGEMFKGRSGLKSKIFPRLTIIQLDAPKYTDSKDPVTGIRIVTLPPNPVKFSTHQPQFLKFQLTIIF